MNQSIRTARQRFRAFYNEWDDVFSIITGVVVFFVSIAVVLIALNIRSTSQATNQTATVSCQRTVLFAPFIYDYFKREKIFPKDVIVNGVHHDLLAEYKSTIPTDCD